MIGKSGWRYDKPDVDGRDARKLVTLRNANGMEWVGIRAWHSRGRYWMNGGEPEAAMVIAWQDLPLPAPGYWQHGRLVNDDPLVTRKL